MIEFTVSLNPYHIAALIAAVWSGPLVFMAVRFVNGRIWKERNLLAREVRRLKGYDF